MPRTFTLIVIPCILVPTINLSPAEKDFIKDFQTSDASQALGKQGFKKAIDEESDEGEADNEDGDGIEGGDDNENVKYEDEDTVSTFILQPSS